MFIPPIVDVLFKSHRLIFLQIQSDSESSSPIVELNSATEISTDSEFEQDPVKFPPPNIVIDDTHLRKPTKVQVNPFFTKTNSKSNRLLLLFADQTNNNREWY